MSLDGQRAVPPLRSAVGLHMGRAAPPGGPARRGRVIGPGQIENNRQRDGRDGAPPLFERGGPGFNVQHRGVRRAFARRTIGAVKRRTRRLALIRGLVRGLIRGLIRRWFAAFGCLPVTAAVAACFKSRSGGGGLTRSRPGPRMRRSARRPHHRHRPTAAQRRPHADEQGKQDSQRGVTHGVCEYIGQAGQRLNLRGPARRVRPWPDRWHPAPAPTAAHSPPPADSPPHPR